MNATRIRARIKRLRQLLACERIKLTEVARWYPPQGCDPSWLSHLLSGRKPMSVKTCERLCFAVQTSVLLCMVAQPARGGGKTAAGQPTDLDKRSKTSEQAT